MKQALIVILALFYLILGFELSFNLHYCQGQLVDVNLKGHEASCCCKKDVCSSEPVNNDCCGDQSIMFKVDDWQVVSSVPLYEVTSTNSLACIPHNEEVLVTLNDVDVLSFNKAPPRQKPLWLLYHRLTYYSWISVVSSLEHCLCASEDELSIYL